jgi:hypothetical protein
MMIFGKYYDREFVLGFLVGASVMAGLSLMIVYCTAILHHLTAN